MTATIFLGFLAFMAVVIVALAARYLPRWTLLVNPSCYLRISSSRIAH